MSIYRCDVNVGDENKEKEKKKEKVKHAWRVAIHPCIKLCVRYKPKSTNKANHGWGPEIHDKLSKRKRKIKNEGQALEFT